MENGGDYELKAHGGATILLPYSGKFSLVQNFTEMCPDSSEEIFAFFLFCGSKSVRENHKNLHPANISHCMVYHRKADLPQTSNPLALGSNSTEVPLNTTFMTNPGNIPTTALPCMECGDMKVG